MQKKIVLHTIAIVHICIDQQLNKFPALVTVFGRYTHSTLTLS